MRTPLLFLLLLFIDHHPAKVEVEKPAPKPEFGITLRVSASHRSIFGLEKKEYKDFESFFVFNTIKQKTEGVCGKTQKVADFNWVVSALVNGCLNFYMMNDLGAVKAFEQINRIAATKKDCYTVGFSQLYLMNDKSNCVSVNSIDIDWRILYTHYQIMLYYKKGMQLFNELDMGNLKPSIHQFCSSVDIEACRKSFAFFMDTYKGLDFVSLQMGFLHQLQFARTGRDIVLYVSNAIDPEYTTKKQYDELVNNIFAALTDQSAYIIYHTGGNYEYAIYRLHVLNGQRIISTVCRDNLVWAPSYGSMRGKPYKTYLDDNKNHVWCR